MHSRVDEVSINGKTVSEWDTQWREMKGGFLQPPHQLRGQVGLFCAVLDGRRMYIGCSAAWDGGKLAERIQAFKRKPQTGNDHYGAWIIREHLDDLALEVILLGTSPRHCDSIVTLKFAMIAHHQPPWNVRLGGARP